MKCKIKNCDAEVDPMFKPWCYKCGTEIEVMAPKMFYRETAKYLRKYRRKMKCQD